MLHRNMEHPFILYNFTITDLTRLLLWHYWIYSLKMPDLTRPTFWVDITEYIHFKNDTYNPTANLYASAEYT